MTSAPCSRPLARRTRRPRVGRRRPRRRPAPAASISARQVDRRGRRAARQLAAGDRRRHRIGAGLDAVGHHGDASAPCRRSTPSIVMVSGADALDAARPCATRQSARSMISGSRAALTSTRRRPWPAPPPSAGSRSRRPRPSGRRTSAPFRPPWAPWPGHSRRCSSISAPSSSSPLRCRSTGRVPMAQPPGSETSRLAAARASSGPSTSTEARILRTRS